MSNLEDNILSTYTEIKPCIVPDEPDAHTVWLKVGAQKFCVTNIPCETKEEAIWVQKRLAEALASVVSIEIQSTKDAKSE